MYLVIDIGGTFIKHALMDTTGEISEKGKVPTPETSVKDRFLTDEGNHFAKKQLEKLVRTLFSIIDDYDVTALKGIAMSSPGTIDVESGVIYGGGSLPFLHQKNLAKMINDQYGIEVAIENDAKCAALAELWLGSVKDVADSAVLVLGTGVGGGIIINKKLHRGVNLSAGELSYVMNEVNPVTREAHFVGLEGSAVEMVRKIAKVKQLADHTDGIAVFEYINNQDKEALEIFNAYCTQIAALALNIQYILDPEKIAIGGGISAQPILIERIQSAVNEIIHKNPLHILEPNIVPCHFQSDANLYGALYHFLTAKKNK